MERLTKRISEHIVDMSDSLVEFSYQEIVRRLIDKLCIYEDLEEQGLLLRLPCKVGDTLCWIDAYGDLRNSEVNSMFVEQGIDGVIIETLICNISAKELGKTVFLTKEEAEAALEKMKEGENEQE